MHVRSGTTVVSLFRSNWREYSWRQLELLPDFQSLPTQNIYIEKLTGWERLEEWRTRRKLQLFYNIQNGSTPLYLLDLIHSTIQSTTIYPLRNGNTIIIPFCKCVIRILPSFVTCYNLLLQTTVKPVLRGDLWGKEKWHYKTGDLLKEFQLKNGLIRQVTSLKRSISD